MIDGSHAVQALIASSQHYENCIICKHRTRNRGMYFPENSVELGAPEGKTRVVIYPICYKHVDTEEKVRAMAEKAEEYIHSHIDEFNNVTEHYRKML